MRGKVQELDEPFASLYCLDRISPKEYFKKHMPQLDIRTIEEFSKVFNSSEIITPNPVKWTKQNNTL